MIGKGNDIRFIRFQSILITLVLLLGLEVLYKSDIVKSVPPRKSAPSGVYVSRSNAVLLSGVQFQLLQKSWIPNQGSFRILAFDKSQYSENRRVNQKILLLKRIRKKIPDFHVRLIQYHLFPVENDELPVLS